MHITIINLIIILPHPINVGSAKRVWLNSRELMLYLIKNEKLMSMCLAGYGWLFKIVIDIDQI